MLRFIRILVMFYNNITRVLENTGEHKSITHQRPGVVGVKLWVRVIRGIKRVAVAILAVV